MNYANPISDLASFMSAAEMALLRNTAVLTAGKDWAVLILILRRLAGCCLAGGGPAVCRLMVKMLVSGHAKPGRVVCMVTPWVADWIEITALDAALLSLRSPAPWIPACKIYRTFLRWSRVFPTRCHGLNKCYYFSTGIAEWLWQWNETLQRPCILMRN
jgi:hypothetical protein